MLEEQIEKTIIKHFGHISVACQDELRTIFTGVSIVTDPTIVSIDERKTVEISDMQTISEHDDGQPVSFEQQENAAFSPEAGAALGRYEDLGVLGAGGMGEVRKVRDPILKRELAMKILHPQQDYRNEFSRRFTEEAQVCAQLQHPNIVPIHEMGTLKDGRLYFTMKEIKGRPLSESIVSVHRAIKNQRWVPSPSGWTFRKLIHAFHEVCRAVAYAHSKGVLHRDLKPDNIMLGEYGEVLVVDWGLAKILGRDDDLELDDSEFETGERIQKSHNMTRRGQVAGTPAYMSPEQARGEINQLDARTDIYALGTILYEIMSGRPAYEGKTSLDVLYKVLSGPPHSIRNITQISTDSLQDESNTGIFEQSKNAHSLPALPEELLLVCEKAMQRNPEDRFSSVSEVADIVSDWLEGAKNREKALTIVDSALELQSKKDILEQQSQQLLVEAQTHLETIPVWEGEEIKAECWAKMHQSTQLSERTEVLDIQQEQLLMSALTHKSDLEEAHSALASRFYQQHRQAESNQDQSNAKKAAARLQEHASALSNQHPERNEYFSYLKGTGALSLSTDVEDVAVQLERYVPYNRRLIPKRIADLGTAPIVSHSLEMGSYRLRLRKEGHHDVWYPISIGRGEHWDGVDDNGIQRAIHMPKLGSLEWDDCYVPGGWFYAGTVRRKHGLLPQRRVWIDSFVMKQFQISNRHYLQFLDDLVAQDREEEVLQYVPREVAGKLGLLGTMIYGRKADGKFELVADADGDTWKQEWPVLMINWHAAKAYTRWYAERSAQPWRLPHELEWEKSARGVDERTYPWGNAFEASYSCMQQSHRGRALPSMVDSFPFDESVYGVRSMAGNAMDWMENIWSPDWSGVGLQDNTLIRQAISYPEDTFRVNRGGAWNFSKENVTTSIRSGLHPTNRMYYLSFRMCRGIL